MEKKDEFSITRVFNAPRDLVFKACTEEKHLKEWWGPKGSIIKVHKLEVKPEGIFHYQLTGADGNHMWGKFVYKEIIPPSEIVFVSSFSDSEGNIVKDPFGIDFPLEILNKWKLTESDGKTTLTISGYPINMTDKQLNVYQSMFQSMEQGFGGTFEQLDNYLKSIIN